MYSINIVEDDKNISYMLRSYLEKEGYQVTVFNSEKETKENLHKKCNLWLLDISLENSNSGFEILKILRANSEVPAIFISARDMESDKILGFELGSDDYISKPFSIREVILRINALIKRVYGKVETIIKLNNYVIDTVKRTIKDNSNNEIKLTKKEFDLLIYFSKNKNIALSRNIILENIYEENYFGSDRVVDDIVKRLRKKMPGLQIETMHGYGYKLK